MANIIGTQDNDLAFLGTPKNDTITGLGGADHLQGLEGNDALDGGGSWVRRPTLATLSSTSVLPMAARPGLMS